MPVVEITAVGALLREEGSDRIQPVGRGTRLSVSQEDADRLTRHNTAKLVDAPDGIAIDIAGNIYIAEADGDGVTLNGRLEVFRPNGDKWGTIPFAGQRPTGVAFGGPDKTLLFITFETGVRVYKGRCAGLP